MIYLDEKVIVVTGGSGLIGRSIVDHLLELGANVINADLNDFSSEAEFYKLDITNDKEIALMIVAIEAEHGKIDGWVNSAYPRTKDWGTKLENISFDSWRSNVDLHMNSYFVSSKLILDHMVKNESGSLVNISSIYGIVGPDFTVYEGTGMTMPVAYSAIKAGIINMDRYFASYYGKKGIRVNTVSPGGIFDNQPASFIDRYNNKVPMGRMGNPEEIAKGVSFLLSDYASYITGHNLVIDGGWTSI
jgi:NAD(P)-dependent dehydrogenase (short-subunit alcohol dehydrogenase family)